MSHKYVYLFSEGDENMRELLGGKGANLAQMTRLGLPVPQGFTISTEACTRYYDDGKKIEMCIRDRGRPSASKSCASVLAALSVPAITTQVYPCSRAGRRDVYKRQRRNSQPRADHGNERGPRDISSPQCKAAGRS